MKYLAAALMFFWVLILTITVSYLLKTDREFLYFTDMVIDDNLKNTIKSGGNTFFVIDMFQIDIGRPDLPIKVWTPVWVEEKDMDKLIQWKRQITLMVRDFEIMDMDSKIAASKVDRWFKKKLQETEVRKENNK